METINISTGVFMIIIGYLVKAYPNLIAGYNTMSKKQKENVDIEGLSTFMRNCFIAMGMLIIVGTYLLKLIDWDSLVDKVILVITLVGVTFMIVKAQKYDHN